jgi:hypothetical protein
MQNQVGLVFNDPLDHFAPLELHGLSHGRRKIDVPLDTVLALDQLHFGREAHTSSYLVIQLEIRIATSPDTKPYPHKLFGNERQPGRKFI